MTTPTIDWINAATGEERERRIRDTAAALDRTQARIDKLRSFLKLIAARSGEWTEYGCGASIVLREDDALAKQGKPCPDGHHARARAEAAEAKLAEVAEHVRETTELDADTMARRVLAILNRKLTP